MLILGVLAGAVAAAAATGLVPQVRAAIARGDLDGGERLVRQARNGTAPTPEWLEALSWLGRGALAARQLDRAEAWAGETREQAVELLRHRKLDADRSLPTALGAAIEVQAQVLAARGDRAAALEFLQQELERFGDTSIRTRIQKNLHLLGLEGKPAPGLETEQWLGSRPPARAEWGGRPVLLFFWAHWCGDCKGMAAALREVERRYGPRGLLIIAPTQRYGFGAGGRELAAEEETSYIDRIRRQHYGEAAVPVSEENFRRWGASTTPTLVLVDRKGIVRLYHPGAMRLEALAARMDALLAE